MHDRLAAALDSQLAEEGVDVELDGVVDDAEAFRQFACWGGPGRGAGALRSRDVRGSALREERARSVKEDRCEGLVEGKQALGHGQDGGSQVLAVHVAGEKTLL